MNTRVTIPDIPNAINPIPSNKSNIVAEVVNVICGIPRLLKNVVDLQGLEPWTY